VRPAEPPTSTSTSCEVARDTALLDRLPRLASRDPGAAQKAYRLFRENPRHPSLQFKKVHNREPVYSVRVTVGYRAVGLLDNDEVAWFWIGSHAEYDRLLNSL
jgi:hypothetical protein